MHVQDGSTANFKSAIRPVLADGDVLWSGGLTVKQRTNNKRIEKRAFRTIFPGQNYDDVIETEQISNIGTTKERPLLKVGI